MIEAEYSNSDTMQPWSSTYTMAIWDEEKKDFIVMEENKQPSKQGDLKCMKMLSRK